MAQPDESLAEMAAEVFDDLGSLGALLDIKLKSGGTTTFGWDQWHPEQQRFDRDRIGWDIILKPRQIGISTLELARDLQYARTHRGVQVLVVVHDGAAKTQLFSTIKLMAESLEKLGLIPKPQYSTKTELTWADNKSTVRIVEAGNTDETAKKRGRSGTVHRLHATEVAFWNAAGETMTALLSAVPQDGEVVIESTPNGVGGLFHSLVTEAARGDSRFKLHFYRWFEHPEYRTPIRPGFRSHRPTKEEAVWEERLREEGCDDEQLQWWRDKISDLRSAGGVDKVLQENPVTIESAFRTSGKRWIPPEVTDRLSAQEPAEKKALWTPSYRVLGTLRIYELPKAGHSYIAGADVSEGIGKDASACTVIDWRFGHTAATFRSNTIEPGDFGLALAAICRLYNGAIAAPERNKDGAAVLRSLKAEARYHRIYKHDDGRLGFPTTGETRPVIWGELHRDIIDGVATTPDADTIGECITLVRDKDGKPRARGKGSSGGATDDLFVSWAIARHVRVLKPIPKSAGQGTGRGSEASKLAF